MLGKENYVGRVVYGAHLQKGKHVGVDTYRIEGYNSCYEVRVVGKHNQHSVMKTWNLYPTRKEATPKPCLSARQVAAKCVKHIEVLFSQESGGLYGR